MDEPDLHHFRFIPWCSALLSNPEYATTPTFSRQYKASTEDSLIAETLKSSNTIPHCLSIYKIPAEGGTWIDEVRTLVTLGSGLNGGVHALHGGIISTLIDDVMGTLLTINKDSTGGPLTSSTVTAKLEVRYLRRIETPGTVVVIARCKKKEEGRKFWLEGTIEDSAGQVMAKGDAFWVKIAKNKEKL